MAMKRKLVEETLGEVNIKSLSNEELDLFINNYGSVEDFLVEDDRESMNLKDVMYPAKARFFKQTNSTTSEVRNPNVAVGDVILLPTSKNTLNQLGFAYALIDSITVMGETKKHYSIVFTVIGHMGTWSQLWGDQFWGILDQTYTSTTLPHIVMVPIKNAADLKLKAFKERVESNQPRGKQRSSQQGKVVVSTVGNISSAYFGMEENDPSDQSNSKSLDSKIFIDDDGIEHPLDSKLASSFQTLNKTWWRIMSETKYRLLVNNMLVYDSTAWDERELPFRDGNGSESEDPEIASLGNIYLLSEMPLHGDQEKTDRARHMSFKINDWNWLSIIDFKLDPSAVKIQEFGRSRGGRIFLLDCIAGILIFIKVYFYYDAQLLMSKTINFLKTELNHQHAYYDFIFLRAKIEALFAKFFTSVRNSKTHDILHPTRVFARKGDVWKLFGDYEDSMFVEIYRDVYPHSMFVSKNGELSKINRNNQSTSMRIDKDKSSIQHIGKSTKKNDMCSFYLRHALGMSHPKYNTPYKECGYGTSCSFQHIELSTLTSNEAKLRVQGLEDEELLVGAIETNVCLFKE